MEKRSYDKKGKIALLCTFVTALAVCASTLAACTGAVADHNEVKYAEACELLEARDYEAAYALFASLGDYKDAAEEAAKFHYVFDGYTETYGMPEDMNTETAVVTYNEDNLPIKCEKTYLDGFVHTCTFEYDENGKLITNECFDGDEFYVKHQWTYDAKGNNLTYSFRYYDGTSYAEERTYDEQGNNITIEAEGTGGHYDSTYESGYHASYKIFYDEKGNNTKFTAIDGDETMEGEFWYTEDDILTKSLVTVKCGEEVSLEEEIYDEKGNKTRKTITKDGEVIESSDFTYDEKGNCLGEVFQLNDEEGEFVSTLKYTYDAKDNCIKRELAESDGYTSVRDITFRLVYVPYEYSEEAWKTMMDELYEQ